MTSEVTTATALTDEEKKAHKDFAEELAKRGFRHATNDKGRLSPLYNFRSGEYLPLEYLSREFPEWLASQKRECSNRSASFILRNLPAVVGEVFRPGQPATYVDPQTKCKYANTYLPYKALLDSADVARVFLDHFERLWPNAEQRHLCLQWIAHMFQRPAERPSWHLMLISDTRTGKGYLVNEILTPLLNHVSVVSDYKRVTGQFSGVLKGNILVLLDDPSSGSVATQTKLKSMLSEPYVFVEPKFGTGGMQPTFARFITASNESIPLHFDENEARWYVPDRIEHLVDRAETQRHVAKLDKWVKEPGSLDKIYNWFMSYPLDGFNPKCCPESEGLAEIVRMSRNPVVEAIKDFASEHPVFTRQEVIEALADGGYTKPGNRELPHLLREAGYPDEAKKVRVGDNFPRLFMPSGMSVDEARRVRGN